MRQFLPAIFVLLVCSSCQVYQYNILSSATKGKPNEPFTFEDDTLRIQYSFHNGETEVELYNKLSQPLYIDWSRSGLIINRDAISYWVYDSISIIRPLSRIRNTPMPLPEIMDVTGNERYPEFETFTERDSPLAFRSQLLLSVDKEFFDVIQYDHYFWISEIQRYNRNIYVTRKQNAYMTSVLTETGVVVLDMSLVAIAFGALVLSHTNPAPPNGQ